MPTLRKPRTMLQVHGFAFGREQFGPEYLNTVNKALDFMQARFAETRGLVCFLTSGTLHPDGTFERHDDGISMRLTTVLRSATAAA